MVATDIDLAFLTAAEARSLFRKRELSPVDLTLSYLERIERLQPLIRAYITITAEAALLRGDERPLLGIPVAYRDLYMTAGLRTTAGSRVHEHWVPDVTATAVSRLHDAGVVMLGKLSTHEFASGLTSENHPFPPARNPWNTEHVPCGSSSGSGAALASGQTIGALGTDTGGSIRGPGSLCGIAALKPTYARCSHTGVFPRSWSLGHTSPMARSVEDVAMMLNVLAGYDPLDAHSATEPVQDYLQALDRPVKGLRLGLPTPDYLEGCDPEVIAALHAAAGALTEQGAVVVEVTMPSQELARGAMMLSAVEAHAYHRPDLLDTPGSFGPNLGQRFLAGGGYFASELIQGQRIRSLLTEHLHNVLREVDVILTPTQPKPAATMENAAKESGGRSGASFTGLYNMTGLPSLSVPSGFSSAGLPLSLLISGRPFDEATVLRVGHAYQRLTDWHLRHPDL